MYWQHKLRLFSIEPPAIACNPLFASSIGERSSAKRPVYRKIQRELINGLQTIERRVHQWRMGKEDRSEQALENATEGSVWRLR